MKFKNLLKIHWANFNQTWRNASLGEGDSTYSNKVINLFPKGDIHEITNIH